LKMSYSRRIATRAKKWRAFGISIESANSQLDEAEKLWKQPRDALLASCASEARRHLQHTLRNRGGSMRGYYRKQALILIHQIRSLNALQVAINKRRI
jgi:hypothetical protein